MGRKQESPCVRCPYDWDSDVCDNSGGEATCLKWKAWAFDNMHSSPGRPKSNSYDRAKMQEMRMEIRMLKKLRKFEWCHVSLRKPRYGRLVLGKLNNGEYKFIKIKKDLSWYDQAGNVVDSVEYWKEIE